MVITCLYLGLGLLAMYWAHCDSKHAHFMERHG